MGSTTELLAALSLLGFCLFVFNFYIYLFSQMCVFLLPAHQIPYNKLALETQAGVTSTEILRHSEGSDHGTIRHSDGSDHGTRLCSRITLSEEVS